MLTGPNGERSFAPIVELTFGAQPALAIASVTKCDHSGQTPNAPTVAQIDPTAGFRADGAQRITSAGERFRAGSDRSSERLGLARSSSGDIGRGVVRSGWEMNPLVGIRAIEIVTRMCTGDDGQAPNEYRLTFEELTKPDW